MQATARLDFVFISKFFARRRLIRGVRLTFKKRIGKHLAAFQRSIVTVA
jgi:hypothetical protein